MSLRRQAATTATLIPRATITNNGFGVTSSGAIGFSEDVQQHELSLAAYSGAGESSQQGVQHVMMQQQIHKLQKQVENMSVASTPASTASLNKAVMNNRQAFEKMHETLGANAENGFAWPYNTSDSIETGRVMEFSKDAKRMIESNKRYSLNVTSAQSLSLAGSKMSRIVNIYKILYKEKPKDLFDAWTDERKQNAKWKWTDDTSVSTETDIFETILNSEFQKNMNIIFKCNPKKHEAMMTSVQAFKQKLVECEIYWEKRKVTGLSTPDMLRYVRIISYIQEKKLMDTIQTKIKQHKDLCGEAGFKASFTDSTFLQQEKDTVQGALSEKQTKSITWHDARIACNLYEAVKNYETLQSDANKLEEDAKKISHEVLAPGFSPEAMQESSYPQPSFLSTHYHDGSMQSRHHKMKQSDGHPHDHYDGPPHDHHDGPPHDHHNGSHSYAKMKPNHAGAREGGSSYTDDVCRCANPIPVPSSFMKKTSAPLDAGFCTCENPIPIHTGMTAFEHYYGPKTRSRSKFRRQTRSQTAPFRPKRGQGRKPNQPHSTVIHNHYGTNPHSHPYNTRARGNAQANRGGMRRQNSRRGRMSDEFDTAYEGYGNQRNLFQGKGFDEYYT